MRHVKYHLTFLGSVILLPLVRLGLHTLGYKRMSRLLVRLSPSPVNTLDPAWGRGRAFATANQVNRAAYRGIIKASCLERSLLLWWLLRWQRIRGELRVGVTKDKTGMLAHAWVEFEGDVVNDRPDIAEEYLTYPDIVGPEQIGKLL